MHRIYADHKKNSLYLQLSGNIDKRESRNALDKVIDNLENLAPGFELISDLSSYTPLSKSADTTVFALLQTVKEHGVKRIVRIIGEPNTKNDSNMLNSAGFYNCEIVDSLTSSQGFLEF